MDFMDKDVKDFLLKTRADLEQKPEWAIQFQLQDGPHNFVCIKNALDSKFKEKIIIKAMEKLLKSDVVRRVKDGDDIIYGLTPMEDYLVKTAGKITKNEF
jgi:hypothetical protein